jgi:hypothetical protein
MMKWNVKWNVRMENEMELSINFTGAIWRTSSPVQSMGEENKTGDSNGKSLRIRNIEYNERRARMELELQQGERHPASGIRARIGMKLSQPRSAKVQGRLLVPNLTRNVVWR